MKLFCKGKDGGPESTVTGYWLVEIKPLFSIVLLRFDKGSREAFHEHAFNSISWLLKGKLIEIPHNPREVTNWYRPSFKPIYTMRNTFHRVISYNRSWVLSVRGPWAKTWKEHLPQENKTITLTHGRKEI